MNGYTMYIHGMKTQVSKWGNSLGVRIPRSVAADAGITDGAVVEITVDAGAIVVRPVARRYTLEELLDGITPSNKHKELDWGPPVGKEVW